METELKQLIINFKVNHFVNENGVFCDFDNVEWFVHRNEEEDGEESYTLGLFLQFRNNPYSEFGTTKTSADKYIRKLKKIIKDTYPDYKVESYNDSSCGKLFINITLTHK